MSAFKAIQDQVIVVTGASSGIGLATAIAAAQRGAAVALLARSAQTLRDVVEEINAGGGRALAIPTDVGDIDAVQAAARAVVTEFGRIDTWVNNAGVSIYGMLENTNLDDARRLFDTNFWGVVHGSLCALPHLRANGGVLINVGSEVSEAVVPLQTFNAVLLPRRPPRRSPLPSRGRGRRASGTTARGSRAPVRSPRAYASHAP